MGWLDMVSSLPETLSNMFQRNDDDWFDRLSHRYTVVQMIIFAMFLSAEQYVAKPISCWSPAHFQSSWEKYTNSYCWVRNTYYLDFDEEIPMDYNQREHHPIKYYQWVPLILLGQAVFFHIPIIIWRSLNQKTGIDVNTIVETSEVYQRDQELENRPKILDFLVRLTDRYLGYSKSAKHNNVLANMRECTCSRGMMACYRLMCFSCCGKKFGNYMVFVYLIIKLVFIANALGQLYILNTFLGHDYNLYGIHVLKTWFGGSEWVESKRFPRVTLCDMNIRRVGNVHRYTIQCVLTINLFNEMIFLYIWFWLVFVASVSIYGLISWLLRTVFPGARYRYIKSSLQSHPDFHIADEFITDKGLKKFVDEYLRQDGVFVLHLVDLNTNKLTLMELLGALWEHYQNKKKHNNIYKPTTENDDVFHPIKPKDGHPRL